MSTKEFEDTYFNGKGLEHERKTAGEKTRLLEKFAEFLEARTGNRMPKSTRDIMGARLAYFLVSKPDYKSIEALYQEIEQANSEAKICRDVIEALLLGETFFFRDHLLFSHLQNKVLPLFDKNRPAATPLCFWSSSCSTGQEAYSLAILTEKFNQGKEHPRPVQILASDCNESSIKYAKAGCYNSFQLNRGLTDIERARFFTQIPQSESKRVLPTLRSVIDFQAINLLSPLGLLPEKPFDIIFCRNTLMYMDDKNRGKVLALLLSCLKSDGFLALGISEMPGRQIEEGLLIPQKNVAGLYRIDSEKRERLMKKMNFYLQKARGNAGRI